MVHTRFYGRHYGNFGHGAAAARFYTARIAQTVHVQMGPSVSAIQIKQYKSDRHTRRLNCDLIYSTKIDIRVF